jgi:dCTP deaminase
MLLKTDEIINSLREDGSEYGRLRIVPPPSEEDLCKSGAASVDLRLGRWFLSLREARTAVLDIDSATAFTRTTFVPFGDRFILHPGKFVLGATLEWICLPSRLGAYVTGKSSWGRRGLIIETAAGIHPGFSGCLTLELANMGEVPIALRPGMPICQIFLHGTSEGDASHGGQFLGRRRPSLGRVDKDIILDRLSRRL